MKRLIIALGFLAVLAGAGVAYENTRSGAAEPKADASRPAPRAVPVVASAVQRKPMPVRIETIGTVQPIATVAIKSRIDGLITRVHFQEGQDVKVGDTLFTLDSRAIEAQLRQAEAQLAKDRAQLANARREVDRQAELVAKSFSSGQKYDEVRTTAAALEATVKADEAMVDNMRVQLSYHTITSPIEGRTGAVALKTGNNVKANDTASLVTINQIRPIYVSFSVPQHELAEIRKAMAGGAPLAVAVQPVGEGSAAEAGRLAFIDNAIDVATGTITCKALFDNGRDTLWPGQFVNAVLTLRVDADALAIPAQAVQIGQSGPYVYVVRSDQTVETRSIATARTVGRETVVVKGLAEGELVVVDGQLRLTNGTKVEMHDAEQKPQDEARATS